MKEEKWKIKNQDPETFVGSWIATSLSSTFARLIVFTQQANYSHNLSEDRIAVDETVFSKKAQIFVPLKAAKLLVRNLQKLIADYEEKYGEIKIDVEEKPTSEKMYG